MLWLCAMLGIRNGFLNPSDSSRFSLPTATFHGIFIEKRITKKVENIKMIFANLNWNSTDIMLTPSKYLSRIWISLFSFFASRKYFYELFFWIYKIIKWNSYPVAGKFYLSLCSLFLFFFLR